jgi:hypothetical protein
VTRCFWPVTAGLLFALTACASSGQLVDHTFSFDTRRDSPDAEVLAYRYGDTKFPMARGDSATSGRVQQQVEISGEMLRPEALYVKWRVKSTGAIYEEHVDLRSRLPSDLANHRVTLFLKGPQLHVFLVSREPANPNRCPSQDGRRKLRASESPEDKVLGLYCGRTITAVYPDRAK